MITQLMLRDFRAYNSRIIVVSLVALALGMLMIFINTRLDRMFAGSTSFIIISIIIPFIPELKNRSTWLHTASLPVSRKAMVISRLLISLIIAAVNLVIWVITYSILLIVLNADPQYALKINTIVIVAMHLLISVALFYLAYFKLSFFGAMAFYVALMILPQLIQTILTKTSDFVIEDFNQPFTLMIVAGCLSLIAFYSSVHYFPKRDL